MIEWLELVIFTRANSSTLYVAPTETDIAFNCTVSFGDSSLADWTLTVVLWRSRDDGPSSYWPLFCAVTIVEGTRIRINVATSGKPCQIKGTNWVRIEGNLVERNLLPWQRWYMPRGGNVVRLGPKKYLRQFMVHSKALPRNSLASPRVSTSKKGL